MEELLIRRMTDEDVRSVLAIERTSFALPWSETSFLAELHKQRSIPMVAVFAGTVVGYICGEGVLEEGHILNLGVDSQHRQKGIAKALVKDIIEELRLRECRSVYLEVRASNLVAKKLYRGFGFNVVGTRKSYYVAPNEDAVVMMLKL